MTYFLPRLRPTARAIAGAAVMMVLGIAPVSAEVCAKSATVATGGPTAFQFAAASQARVAWARKVTRDPALGRSYASWARARAARVTCRQISGRHRCIAVGDPCRRGS